MKSSIAVVLKCYPRLSETFIAQEIHALESAGFDLTLVSLRHPTDKKTHPVNDEIRAPVVYLPEYLYQEPLRVFRAWRKARKLPGYRKARNQWLADFRRDFTANRGRRFGQALVLAAEFPENAGWIYSHFIHTPSSVARYAAEMRDLSWCASAHAKDIWTSPDWELSEKLGSAEWTVTCTAGGAAHLRTLAAAPEKVNLVYHGLDLSRFPYPANRVLSRNGLDKSDPARLLTVGRAVAKKGLDTLVEALALLPSDLSWQWTHIGGGELHEALKAQVGRLGLDSHVTLLGSREQTEILSAYRSSDLFVLPCRIAPNGDRDGLPNVLVEAQSQGLACISTPVSGITELLTDEVNGLLVPPDDPEALSAAIARAIRDPDFRERLGAAGAERVHAEFDHRATIGRLIALFESMGTGAAAGHERAAA
ncbi:glycosyltransferase family 4 protein [Mesorhizobium koreense]|jgi:glycosyltransferase involved in cell wall biosynthesis|uniref:glycosyltransferase family 4 protein n=1 Tax=Mesorhizobium koreense TaxID=3074855 RepID=UPI00287BB1AE|nr:glycosyltransferase family 4 protein [Mesorhizobium sp. WR6]